MIYMEYEAIIFQLKMYSPVSLLLCVVFAFSVAKHDYYWKDYNGVIPADAFAGGSDLGGEPTYIGQTYFPAKNIVVPTVIVPGERSASVNIGNEKLSSDLYTKILCSSNNSLFRWVPSDTKKVHYLTGCKQIPIGHTWDAPVTVGRANIQGRTMTGRLYDYSPKKWHGLWVHDGTYKDVVLSEFEVLVYDCENPWIEEV